MDRGLFVVAVILIVLGAAVLYTGEAALMRPVGREHGPVTGTAANIIGWLLIAAGLYFVFESRKK